MLFIECSFPDFRHHYSNRVLGIGKFPIFLLVKSRNEGRMSVR